MDQINNDILNLLRKNGRLSNKEIGKMGSYVKNPDIKVRTNLTFNLNYLI
ncbi:AsnC family protein [Latilactobacillus curvatus]|nr:AsnC family protein [Latilactobacillus curvatus]